MSVPDKVSDAAATADDDDDNDDKSFPLGVGRRWHRGQRARPEICRDFYVQVRTQPLAPCHDGGPQSVRSPCVDGLYTIKQTNHLSRDERTHKSIYMTQYVKKCLKQD
ncbi:hypothetical protein PoB_001655300 [Plakobranchus ocellatus]|uniref:Uncharacterized protein n=1 Tax=Plakobranchus ocellatus TaxID=259542 RepID=A0AAV3Z5R2_9GAST|nr:hypothetical protein PoB_001655300 [Plakobranchus ocellatus]